MLSQSQGGISIQGIDPTQAFRASQHQMLRMTYELERSANVGIGYAFSVAELINDCFFDKF